MGPRAGPAARVPNPARGQPRTKADGAPRRDPWHRARQERGGASRELGPTSRRRAAAAADVTLLNAARPARMLICMFMLFMQLARLTLVPP